MLDSLAKDHEVISYYGRKCKSGGFGSAVVEYLHTAYPEVQVLSCSTSDVLWSMEVRRN